MTAPLITNHYDFGTAITFYTQQPFTAVDGTVVDPDKVMFGFQINGDSSSTYTWSYENGVGDPTNTIVRTGIGTYSVTIDTTQYAVGVWVYSFACAPVSTIAIDTTQTQIRALASCVVEAVPFVLQ
jgi:hypothetical protein